MNQPKRGTGTTPSLGRVAASMFAAALTAACGSNASEPAVDAVEPEAPAEQAAVAPTLPVVAEAWHSDLVPADPGIEYDIDSLAVWETAPGEAIVIVTAKQGHELWVHDANTGERVRTVGSPGSGPGEFQRPNGLVVVDDLVIVVERDNARLQVLRLPDFEHVGFIGEEELTRPYGVAAFAADDGVEVYITDNYETPDEEIPPAEELGRRVRHFRFSTASGELTSSLVNTFGDTSGDGVLNKVETIAVDPANDRLLIVDELETELAVRIYGLDGAFRRNMGVGDFAHEPEGIALFETADGGGYWLATDQQESLSLFLVFDRRSLEFLGGFTGDVTANTDGVALTQLPLRAFPEGAFYAVNADLTVTAFDWREIARTLGF